MPLLDSSSYRSPLLFRNGHIQSLWPVLFRPKGCLPYQRQRLDTPDGDFIDLDILTCPRSSQAQNQQAVILSHGLEGNSQRAYMRGMASLLHSKGWDIWARNMRGCSGEPNRTRRITHMGDSDDLHTVVLHACQQGYTRLVLIGFSMGGNQSLNYLCQNPDRVPDAVQGCVAISVPCELLSAVKILSLPSRRIYMEYFLRSLRQKMRTKAQQFPDFPDTSTLDSMRTFAEFDGQFTAPVHGFSSAIDYWTQASSAPHLHKVRVPTLLINAADDPFMAPPCYPTEIARHHPLFHLEIPPHGGHVGFVTLGGENVYWSEKRTLEFIEEEIGGAVRPPVPPEAGD